MATWTRERRPWGRGDLLALSVWTVAVGWFFWDAVSLRQALFYFDITEINYPYRDFFARELRAGRFSRWCPGLYCGLPLFSESQAGYLHPLKYLLYPWLATWQAFNLDTVLSIWLAGLGAFVWLRRHVGSAGALTGAAVFGLSGFVWAHLIHTSMTNALASVPWVFWALESAWERGRWRWLAPGALALACEIFAGHFQETILTVEAIGLYGLYRGLTERGWRARLAAPGMAAGIIALGLALGAVQWVPSKELLDRSPRAGGLSWDRLTYGSWHPELLPTLVVREAYGTRARDTDWMDGFYPYHEMNAYMGVIALALAVVGASAARERWVAFWIILAGLGGVLMLGRFTFLFDLAHRIPILGSSRIPVRFHLWVSLAVAALASVGVDRISRPGVVRLRGALRLVGVLVLVSIAILLYAYEPAWAGPHQSTVPYFASRSRWLGRELTVAVARTFSLSIAAWGLAELAVRATATRRRLQIAALLPVLVIADLLGSHARDVPLIAPDYWTRPPLSARRLQADPACVRVFGAAERSAGEPGYASAPVDYLSIRDPLDWSLPPVWGLQSSGGETPIYPRRMLEYTDHVKPGRGRFEIEGVTHLLTARPLPLWGTEGQPAGSALIYRNQAALPRVRLAGRPLYAANESAAVAALERLGERLRDRVVVEDPDSPLPTDAVVSGTASITIDRPEHVEVATDAAMASYLVLADSFDPGWSARLDGRPVPIRPAYVAFTYCPAGWRLGLAISVSGLVVTLALLIWPRRVVSLASEHGELNWPRGWPWCGLAILAVILVGSILEVGPTRRPAIQNRWTRSFHQFTWGNGIGAMRPPQGR